MSQIVAMAIFAVSMSVSPGPVNIITFSNGVNHGFRAALPFVSGAAIGFTALLAAIGFGLAVILQLVPALNILMVIGGSIFLIYLGYKIATAGANGIDADKDAPSGFWAGAALQCLNPKAWAACIAGVSAFNLSGAYEQLSLFISVYFVICYASIAAWAYVGDKMQALVKAPGVLRYLNLAMGIALAGIAALLVAAQLTGMQ